MDTAKGKLTPQRICFHIWTIYRQYLIEMPWHQVFATPPLQCCPATWQKRLMRLPNPQFIRLQNLVDLVVPSDSCNISFLHQRSRVAHEIFPKATCWLATCRLLGLTAQSFKASFVVSTGHPRAAVQSLVLLHCSGTGQPWKPRGQWLTFLEGNGQFLGLRILTHRCNPGVVSSATVCSCSGLVFDYDPWSILSARSSTQSAWSGSAKLEIILSVCPTTSAC